MSDEEEFRPIAVGVIFERMKKKSEGGGFLTFLFWLIVGILVIIAVVLVLMAQGLGWLIKTSIRRHGEPWFRKTLIAIGILLALVTALWIVPAILTSNRQSDLWNEASALYDRGSRRMAESKFRSIVDIDPDSDYGRKAAALLSHFCYRYRLRIVSASITEEGYVGPPLDAFDDPDPYVAWYVNGKYIASTSEKEGTYSPSWNESFEIELATSDMLRFTVEDNDGFWDPDLVGEFESSVRNLVGRSQIGPGGRVRSLSFSLEEISH